MEDQVREPTASPTHGSSEPADQRNEPVRSRWTPKPEQILILESIFNSGMVNPPKEETVKIRKVLEKFGSVGDANVFYWFQNRRSRSRRRQRQIQATLISGDQQIPPLTARCSSSSSSTAVGVGGAIHQFGYSTSANMGFETLNQTTSPYFSSSSSSSTPFGIDHDVVSLSGMPEFDQNSSVTSTSFFQLPSDSSSNNLHNLSAGVMITVFINGVQKEVQRGPLDMKAMFGQDLVLVHSSGLVVPFNDHGFSLQSLQHGESYFLVSRPI